MKQTVKFITMNGLSLNGSGLRKEQNVHPDNVQAFKNSGWVVGALPQNDWSNELGKIKYTLEDSIAQLGDTPTPEPKRTRKTRGK